MSIPGFDPETAGNHEEIEMQFAVKTVEHLEVSPGSQNYTVVDEALTQRLP